MGDNLTLNIWRTCTIVCISPDIGYPLKLYFQIPCVFPVKPQIFPVPISVTCDYYIHKTDLPDLSSFGKKMEISAANIAISFTFRIREFTTCPNKIPCVFPDRDLFWSFSLFSLCHGYPADGFNVWIIKKF